MGHGVLINNTGTASCDQILKVYVYNLTSSYADQRNEGTMVATSIIMFALAALFFTLNLFSRFSDVSAVLNPSIRLFLSTSLSLFLPVMSYLFSEAKNQGAAAAAGGGGGGEPAGVELSLRPRIILMWMLLVEILRKKVEKILVSAGVQAYSSTIERAARIAWLGYLVFYNLRSAGKKALYGILWVLAAAKLVQRFVTLELAKRSFAYGKNPELVTSYMAHQLRKQGGSSSSGSSELLEQCSYVVAGEEDLEKKAGPSGYALEPPERLDALTKDDSSTVITVGKIWRLAAKPDELLLKSDSRLKKLCFSFALYKLLHRRLEDFPITVAETRDCHNVVFNGLYKEAQEEEEERGRAGAPAAAAGAVLRVFHDEVQLLCEYYHSVHPVVLASPFFLVTNYFLFLVVVWAFCVFMIILCSNGDVRSAFDSFRADNYAVSFGILKMTGCILSRVARSSRDLFSAVDISITVLLFLAVGYEQVWEFIVFLLSNWFMVSLLCSYASKEHWRKSPLLGRVIRLILWVRNRLSNPSISVKQLSVLWWCRLPSLLPTKPLPLHAKHLIMERLAKQRESLSGGRDFDVWQPQPPSPSDVRRLLQPAVDAEWLTKREGETTAGVAEAILIWHVATAMLDATYPPPSKPGAERKAATALSGYCAYLLTFQPGLLPDDRDGTERVYKDMTKELKEAMGGCLWYYCSRQGARLSKLQEMTRQQDQEHAAEAATTALRKGAKLGNFLVQKAENEAGRADVWKLLAEVWTEVVVCTAPTASELHLKAHKEALAQGGEFITVLWALTTHTGIGRGPPPPAAGV